ncbi:MAG: type II toxin-antitoxin system VapC family toxin [Armatimonadota bacterium]
MFSTYLERALEIALASRITVYDASYVALAESLGCQLVTGDSRLLNMLQGRPYQMRSLAEFHARYAS